MPTPKKPKAVTRDPATGIHPDTNRPRMEEIRVLTPANSPSRMGFGGPGGTNPPSGPGPMKASRRANSADTHPLAQGGPAGDAAMGAARPKKVAKKSSAKKAAKKKAKKPAAAKTSAESK